MVRYIKLFNNKYFRQASLLIILVTGFLLPRVFSIGKFVAVDEVNWLFRSANFYDAVVRRDWSGTYVSDHPGVITSWVGALAFKIAAPGYKVTRELDKKSYITFENNLIKKAGVQPLYVLATSRVIMILLLMSVWLLCFFYAQRLFGVIPSLLGFLIIALDPFFIALTRMSHLDAPQAVFMFLSILAFLNFLYRGNRWLDLVVSGITGGLAFLSKLPGIFIIPTIGILGLWEYLRARSVKKVGNPNIADKSLKKLIQYLLVWALVFVVTYSAIWPSMWVQPIKTLERVFNTSANFTRTIIEENPEEQEIDTNSSPTRSLTDYLRYPNSFLWRTTPVVLLGLLLLLVAYFRRIDQVMDEPVNKSLQGLLIFAIIYTIGVTLPTQSSEKYYAPVYLVLDFLAGLGWYSFVFHLTKGFREIRGKIIAFATLVAVITIQSIWVYQSYPYYFTHYNPFLGSLSRAAQVKYYGVGEGLDQAGLYLMTKPESSKLKVMAWYGIGPFSYFFNGNVFPLYMSNSAWTPEFIQRLKEMDYLVIYSNQRFRRQPPELFDLLSGVAPEHIVTIDGAEYAWIYEVSDLALP
jgi:4-amino-4-deoxy-L-arabinose transferase-like glycosyltransferase